MAKALDGLPVKTENVSIVLYSIADEPSFTEILDKLPDKPGIVPIVPFDRESQLSDAVASIINGSMVDIAIDCASLVGSTKRLVVFPSAAAIGFSSDGSTMLAFSRVNAWLLFSRSIKWLSSS